MKRISAAGAVLALSASLLVLPATSAGAAPLPCEGRALRVLRSGNASETISFRTFYIEAKPTKKSYKVGDTVKIEITVTRPADEDPLRLGLPWSRPTTMPAEGVYIGVGVLVGQTFLPGFSTTDADGKAVVEVDIADYTKPGKAMVSLYAWKIVLDVPCARVEETGYRAAPNFFTVKPQSL